MSSEKNGNKEKKNKDKDFFWFWLFVSHIKGLQCFEKTNNLNKKRKYLKKKMNIVWKQITQTNNILVVLSYLSKLKLYIWVLKQTLLLICVRWFIWHLSFETYTTLIRTFDWFTTDQHVVSHSFALVWVLLRSRWRMTMGINVTKCHDRPLGPVTNPRLLIRAHFSFIKHTSAYVIIRQHTSASVSIRQHTERTDNQCRPDVRVRSPFLLYLFINPCTPTCSLTFSLEFLPYFWESLF
jgi:hypothetical protein